MAKIKQKNNVPDLPEWEIMLNQAQTDIEQLEKDVVAGLYAHHTDEELREFNKKAIDIGKKLGKAELLGKQWREAGAEQKINEELESESKAQKYEAIII